jgi:hypothetical protein
MVADGFWGYGGDVSVVLGNCGVRCCVIMVVGHAVAAGRDMVRLLALATIVLAVLLVAACSSDGGEEEIAAAQPSMTEAAEPTPTPTGLSGLVPGSCSQGTPVLFEGEPACSFSFEAEDTPARLQAYAPLPNDQQTDFVLHATCTPGSCVSFETGEPVTEEDFFRIDWRIVEPGTITVTTLSSVLSESDPPREWRFEDFGYEHPPSPVCADNIYCYTVTTNYELIGPATFCWTEPAPTPSAELLDIRPPCSLVQSHESVQSPEEALAQDLALIAEEAGWTIEEAAEHRRIADIAGRIQGQIAAERPDIFIGGALSEEPGGPLTMYIKGPADEYIRSLVAGAEIEIIIVDNQLYSRAELDARQSRVSEALLAKGYANFAVGTDIRTARIEADVTRQAGLPDDPEKILAALPADLRDSVDVEVSDAPVVVDD